MFEGFTTIDWMAFIFIVAAVIKIIVLLINPISWNNFTKSIWASPAIMMVISLVLAGLTLYYLIQSGITIIQIFAVMLFFMFLAAIGIALYKKEVVALADRLLREKNIVKKSWFYILIWIALLIWGIATLFSWY